MSGYQRQNNGGGRGGNWNRPAPKPRGIVPPPHHLNPVAEEFIANKEFMGDFKRPGKEVTGESVTISGRTVKLPVACLMVTHQFGVPHDHEQMIPIRKIDTNRPDTEYVPVHTHRMQWVTDASFYHIPGYTRYVINDAGDIKNASTGEMVHEKVFDSKLWTIELVCDGRSNQLSKVSVQHLGLMVIKELPQPFFDYGFRNYSHEIALLRDKGHIGWRALPTIATLSIVNGAEKVFRNQHEFSMMGFQSFEERNNARALLRKLVPGEVVTIGEYKVMYGDAFDHELAMKAIRKVPVPDMHDDGIVRSVDANSDYDDSLGF